MTKEEEFTRIDLFLVKSGYAKSRERAKILIENGFVFVDGRLIEKPSNKIGSNSKIDVRGEDIKWVSRAGLKLEHAFNYWDIDVNGSVCVDIGSSTGGFTEVLLDGGASKIYSVDVGKGQLDKILRDNKKIVVMEETNIKNCVFENIDFITTDVSFISIKKIIPNISSFLKSEGEAVLLIKPQFEVGKKFIKRGVVRESDLHKKVVEDIKSFAFKYNLNTLDVIESPIKGISGNKEFLAHIKKF